MKIHSRN